VSTPGLFDEEDAATKAATKEVPAPLAERMRPRTLDELVGQEHLLSPGKPLREAIDADVLQSIILWGPPGTGKTTLARLIATVTRAHFIQFSAVLSGIKEIKTVMQEAEDARRKLGRRTILFVDEIHRFNKAQQDAFLPRVEAGDLVLIGATTENPSFEVNAALLSRSKVFVLKLLDHDALIGILSRAWTDGERGLGRAPESITSDALTALARYANGDARVALGTLELIAGFATRRKLPVVDLPTVAELLERRSLLYDKTGEEHYNIISALHKSLRNSDPDAAVYWLARMLEAGEDPLYVARRLVRFASEDIGNADPQALVVTVAATQATHQLGMPEANTALAQAAIYLATAPKSNAVYAAYGAASQDAMRDAAEPVPLHLRNAPTKLMKQLEYGKGYRYAHNEPDAIAAMDCLPPSLQGRQYYAPKQRGYEKELARRLERWAEIKQQRRTASTSTERDRADSPADDDGAE
jgi:putative ATPase